jgi:acetate kinase
VHHGQPLDTSMGFTPTSGIVMGTRSGDLDPGVLIHLMHGKGYDASRLDELVNHQAGLLGVSGLSPDMKTLLERRSMSHTRRRWWSSFVISFANTSGR